MITERRRLTASATTPVGTSKTNAAASSAVPSGINWKGSRAADRER